LSAAVNTYVNELLLSPVT